MTGAPLSEPWLGLQYQCSTRILALSALWCYDMGHSNSVAIANLCHRKGEVVAPVSVRRGLSARFPGGLGKNQYYPICTCASWVYLGPQDGFWGFWGVFLHSSYEGQNSSCLPACIGKSLFIFILSTVTSLSILVTGSRG